jgi:hypothetical protein
MDNKIAIIDAIIDIHISMTYYMSIIRFHNIYERFFIVNRYY